MSSPPYSLPQPELPHGFCCSLGALLKRLAFRHVSVRPQHPQKDAQSLEAHKKLAHIWFWGDEFSGRGAVSSVMKTVLSG
jgi:hypothetical protein